MNLYSRQASSINYLADKSQFPFFYTENLVDVIAKLSHAVGHRTEISVYPDATLKSNKLPTGVVFRAKTEHAMLLPFVLRDPGCSYTLFKLEFTDSAPINWQNEMGSFLNVASG